MSDFMNCLAKNADDLLSQRYANPKCENSSYSEASGVSIMFCIFDST